MADLNENRILIGVPDVLLKEFDSLVDKRGSNRTETIREAMRFYLKYHNQVKLDVQ